MEWFGLEGTFKIIKFLAPAMGMDNSTWPGCSGPHPIHPEHFQKWDIHNFSDNLF